jgi:hypothetical protein
MAFKDSRMARSFQTVSVAMAMMWTWHWRVGDTDRTMENEN